MENEHVDRRPDQQQHLQPERNIVEVDRRLGDEHHEPGERGDHEGDPGPAQAVAHDFADLAIQVQRKLSRMTSLTAQFFEAKSSNRKSTTAIVPTTSEKAR